MLTSCNTPTRKDSKAINMLAKWKTKINITCYLSEDIVAAKVEYYFDTRQTSLTTVHMKAQDSWTGKDGLWLCVRMKKDNGSFIYRRRDVPTVRLTYNR
jgi:hypothetical protein